jgi:NAD(P)-dependent dehydrogenase (short-subunit alcohol dehydrogenase family)
LFATYPSLADRVVLITGGGSGIGAELVRAFATNDARVAFLDVNEHASAALVSSLGDARHEPVFIRCDLRDIEALQTAIDTVRQTMGPVSALINNAGYDERHEVDDVTPAYWDDNMAVNLKHMFFTAQAVRPHMRELGFGSIVNLSSIAWMRGAPRLVVYASAKAAIVGMTRSLAGEVGPDNIRVNAIAPGAVVTERQLRLWYNETTLAAVVDRQCLKHRLLPPDIARMALFLAADDSRMITKQTFVVDAGLL